jgi:hypothetical protein
MASATFEDHPTDPDKVILRKPRYEEDDDIQAYVKPWVGLTQVELELLCDEWRIIYGAYVEEFAKDIEKKIKEKNGA